MRPEFGNINLRNMIFVVSNLGPFLFPIFFGQEFADQNMSAQTHYTTSNIPTVQILMGSSEEVSEEGYSAGWSHRFFIWLQKIMRTSIRAVEWTEYHRRYSGRLRHGVDFLTISIAWYTISEVVSSVSSYHYQNSQSFSWNFSFL